MKKITKEQMLDAIKGSSGIITVIQRKITNSIGEHLSWATTRKYIEKWKETQEAYKEEKEVILDIAEQNIYAEIVNKKDVALSKWYLATKGKDRGYNPNPTLQLTNTDPLNINLVGDMATAEELAASSTVEIPEYNDEQ